MYEIGALKSLFDRYDNLVFFDVETTGFNADKDDRIIELAAIQANAEGIVRQEDLLVQLPEGRSVPDKIVNLTGITDLMLLSGVTDEACARTFSEMIEGKTLLAAHNAQFDLNFAAFMYVRHMKEHGEWMTTFTRCDYLDTLTVYKDRAGFPHKLKDAITHYGLDGKVQNTHRAIDDAKALWAVFDAMAEERDDLAEYVNIFGYNDRYGVSGPIFKKVKYYSQNFGFGMKDPEQTLPRLENKTEWRQR